MKKGFIMFNNEPAFGGSDSVEETHTETETTTEENAKTDESAESDSAETTDTATALNSDDSNADTGSAE